MSLFFMVSNIIWTQSKRNIYFNEILLTVSRFLALTKSA